MSFKRGAGLFVLLSLGSGPALADEWSLCPLVDLRLTTVGTQVEGGLASDHVSDDGDGSRTFLGAEWPVGGAPSYGGSTRAIASWTGLWDRTTSVSGSAIRFLSAGVRGEWGPKEYFWQEDPDADLDSGWRHSSSLALQVLHYRHAGRAGATVLAPQAELQYAREWKESGSISFVVFDPELGWERVRTLTVGPPLQEPTLSLRASLLILPGRNLRLLPSVEDASVPIGLGPTLRLSATGPEGELLPLDETPYLETELWLYWFPGGEGGSPSELAARAMKQTSPLKNLRIGLSASTGWNLGSTKIWDPATDFGLRLQTGAISYQY